MDSNSMLSEGLAIVAHNSRLPNTLEGDYDPFDESFSSLGLTNQQFKKADNCFICNCKFSRLRGNPRHHCRFCYQSVCGPHSSIKLTKPGCDEGLRICDECFEQAVISQYNSENRAELERLQQVIEKAEAENDRLRAIEEKSATVVAAAESEIKQFCETADSKLTEIVTRLNKEESRGTEARETMARLKVDIEQASSEEKSNSAKVDSNEAKISKLTGDLRENKDIYQELEAQLKLLEYNRRYTVDIATAQSFFCLTCLNKVYKERSSVSSAMTLSIYSQNSGAEGDYNFPDISGIPYESVLEENSISVNMH